MRFLLYFGTSLFILCHISCSSSKQFQTEGSDRRLLREIESNPVFSKHHTGFALYDPSNNKWLCQFNSDRYFTPASNTKILTLLTCLHVLQDSIETLRYTIKGDSLIFHGMADPAFLFSEIPSSDKSFNILQNHAGSLFFQPGEELDRYGAGWAWDDYSYSYQVEKSTLPIYGNRLTLFRDFYHDLQVYPHYFRDYIEIDSTNQEVLSRDPVANAFILNEHLLLQRDTLEIPFVVTDYETTRLLSNALQKPVNLLYTEISDDLIGVNGTSRDTLLKVMMQESDNFIAEQLLMQCAFYMRGTFNSDSAIAVAEEMIMNGTPDAFQWVDGSGLSRYNLCTPRSLVWVLQQLVEMESMEYLTHIFPAGGMSGTLKEWYVSDTPYVYAKTGALGNQHCLSGYLHTDSGKWLIFSFMHNNFMTSSGEIKKEMEKVLLNVKKKY